MNAWKLAKLVVAFALGGALAMSCGGSSDNDEDEGCDEGTEGCRCYGNDTCDPGLACRSNLCVDLGGGGMGGQPGTGCPTDREECSGACVDLAGDEANCGRCAYACGTGEECSAGLCVCLAGREACNSVCVDTASNPDHCGGCDAACPSEQVCSESACSDDCADGLTACGRSCVDTATSADHCGECDTACGAGLTCEGGECVCPGGLVDCGGSCVNLDDDSGHCGECDSACGAREECVSGECECSSGSVRCGSNCVAGDTCGTGGSGGMGNGGSAGGGMGGASGNAGSSNGGMSGGGNGGSSSGGGGTGGAPGGPPIVMLVVDNSSSMYEPREDLWDALYSALMDPADGAVTTYEDRVRIGLASFRGPDNITVPESDPSCAQIETVGSVNPATVAPGLDNRDAIDVVYAALGAQGRTAMGGDAGLLSWETPTGHALNRVATTLTAFNADPAGRKYIFLLTDGNPNTCRVGDPQCGQDLSIKAAQDARVLGITTLILGFGEVAAASSACPTNARCSELHLQDMANAGTARPVETPPVGYWYEQCARAESGGAVGTPLAAYVPAGMGGTADYYSGMGRTALRAELLTMFDRVLAGTIP
jgi:hypothetical protein